jgi:ABC-type uncharacterized transport system YnjBCD ATPase subunit
MDAAAPKSGTPASDVQRPTDIITDVRVQIRNFAILMEWTLREKLRTGEYQHKRPPGKLSDRCDRRLRLARMHLALLATTLTDHPYINRGEDYTDFRQRVIDEATRVAINMAQISEDCDAPQTEG